VKKRESNVKMKTAGFSFLNKKLQFYRADDDDVDDGDVII